MADYSLPLDRNEANYVYTLARFERRRIERLPDLKSTRHVRRRMDGRLSSIMDKIDDVRNAG